MKSGPERRIARSATRVGLRSSDTSQLTERQSRIAELVGGGASNKEIAGLLGISEQAVKQHVSVLMKKFRATSRAAVARKFLSLRISGRAETETLPLEHLVAKAPLIIAAFRGRDVLTVLANELATQRSLGRLRVGKRLEAAMPELRGQHIIEALRGAALDGQRRVLHQERVNMIRFPGGPAAERWLDIVIEPLIGGTQDRVVTCFAIDVTEQVQAQRALAETAFFRNEALIDQLPLAVIAAGPDGRNTFANARARAMLGLDPDPFPGETFDVRVALFEARDPVTGRRFQPSEMPVARALAGETVTSFRYVITRPTDGQAVVIECASTPTFAPDGSRIGAVTYFVAVAQVGASK